MKLTPQAAGKFMFHLVLNEIILPPVEVEIVMSEEHMKKDKAKKEELERKKMLKEAKLEKKLEQ